MSNSYEAHVVLQGKSPLSFSRPIPENRPSNVSHEAWEEQTWIERLHYDENNEAFIPAMAVKLALENVGSFLREKIPGMGNSEYTSHLRAGVFIVDDLKLGIQKEDVDPEALFVPANGVRGGPTRVWKKFPKIESGWEAQSVLYCVDPKVVTPEVLKRYLNEAGMFVGLLRFRPQKGGMYGRFCVKEFVVKNKEAAEAA